MQKLNQNLPVLSLSLRTMELRAAHCRSPGCPPKDRVVRHPPVCICQETVYYPCSLGLSYVTKPVALPLLCPPCPHQSHSSV